VLRRDTDGDGDPCLLPASEENLEMRVEDLPGRSTYEYEGHHSNQEE
jgi:hypothetical protein